MFYKSTRGDSPAVTAAEAIKNGIAPDGGLYMPEKLPVITESDLECFIGMEYYERAAEILSLFLEDYTKEELTADCKAAYSGFDGYPAPLHYLGDDVRVLELWHGPTCAFKDMALQIMPRLLSRALTKTGEKRTALILVATSGDTGKAALEGFKDVPGTAIQVFYPADGVSRTQKRQMITQEGNNLSVCAINGNFDDAQTGVKRIFADDEFARELDEKGFFLSSANSINWGRLAPQIVYYVSAYCDLIKAGDIAKNERIDFCVPTGNFGNILAAYIAARCGLPIRRLICASNSNNVLTDFLSSGTYNRNRPFRTTISPSMDILISSNLERLLYSEAGSERCTEYMRSLSDQGVYTVHPDVFDKIKKNFAGAFCGEQECLEKISECFASYGYLIDTHTSVALSCADKLSDGVKTVVVSTASPYKFAHAVAGALGIGIEGMEDPEIFKAIGRRTGTNAPAPLAAVFDKPVRFGITAEPDKMKDAVRAFTDLLA